MPAAAPSDPPPTIRHEMIRASAGSGKTYQLTNRFIQLLALGEPPDSIVALTFTRKAAGEFFSEILKKVAEACLDKMKGEQIARDIGMGGKLKPGDYRRMLRTLCRGIDRLTLGTLDSFFAGIVRHFPFELGLAANFEIVDDRLEAAEKRRVYRHVFRREARRDSPRLHDDFLAAFQLATIGGSERSLMARLDSFVGGYHSIYLAAPSPELWGNPRRIWPGGGRWFGGQADLKALGRELLDRFAERELPEKQIDRWRVFLEAAAERVPGSPVQVRTSGYSRPQPIWYLLEKLLAAIDGIESGSAELTVERRRQQLGPGECAAAFAIVRKVMRDELEVWASRTRGIWNVLNLYERYYHKLVRDQGKLRFDDLPLLLTGTGEPGRETGAPPLSGRDGDPIAGDPALPAKLNIEYRLDAKFRHWLLDEFQDTSRGQWRALEDLIDEAAQDDSGQRSVFFVGDVKQSIFAWRGGEPRLFDEIRARYNGGGEARLHERPLAESYRSGPEVIRAVNRVFGDAARGELAAMFPQAAVDRWRWDEHVSKKPEHAAYCAYLQPLPNEFGDKPKPEDCYALAAELVGQLNPPAHGYTCAVIVQRNSEAQKVVDEIRRRTGVPAASESDIAIARDNPATAAFLALLKCAAHPGDTLAWHHVMMTPLGEAIRERNLGQASASTAILEDVLADGFERVLAKWMARLRRAWRDRDPFSERRLEELRACARLFDLSGSRRIAEFLEFADAYKSRDAQSPGVVQVTTVHKSKGLGFDIVILPELGGDSLTATRADLAVKEGDRGTIDWIFRMPVKEFAKADPVLRAYTEEEEADACYESLCDFYVAMTRAKRAMYLIAEPLGKSSQRKNFVRLLEHTLAAGQPGDTAQVGALAAKLRYADGDPDWISRRSGQTPRHQPKLPMPAVPAAKPRRRMARRTPSGSESYALTPAQLFSRDGRAARDFGTAVHALFEDIEWAEDAAPAERRAAWEAQGHDARAIAQTIACLDDAALRQELGRPAPGAAVWRERRFEIALGGEWISGTFDRVTLLPGSDPGTFASAQILDFKTDKASEDETAAQIAERYRPQQELYRRVLAKLANLPENKIEGRLMFTAQREVVRLF